MDPSYLPIEIIEYLKTKDSLDRLPFDEDISDMLKYHARQKDWKKVSENLFIRLNYHTGTVKFVYLGYDNVAVLLMCYFYSREQNFVQKHTYQIFSHEIYCRPRNENTLVWTEKILKGGVFKWAVILFKSLYGQGSGSNHIDVNSEEAKDLGKFFGFTEGLTVDSLETIAPKYPIILPDDFPEFEYKNEPVFKVEGRNDITGIQFCEIPIETV